MFCFQVGLLLGMLRRQTYPGSVLHVDTSCNEEVGNVHKQRRNCLQSKSSPGLSVPNDEEGWRQERHRGRHNHLTFSLQSPRSTALQFPTQHIESNPSFCFASEIHQQWPRKRKPMPLRSTLLTRSRSTLHQTVPGLSLEMPPMVSEHEGVVSCIGWCFGVPNARPK